MMQHTKVGAALFVGFFIATMGWPTGVRAEARLFGIAMGYNGSGKPGQETLRYADDDAVKNIELLDDLGASSILLTELDRETQALYPERVARSPTLAHWSGAIDEINARIASDARAGPSHVFLFFSGHGDVEYNEGFAELQDGRLKRSDLQRLIQSLRADFVHVIVDACKSYYLVFDRGGGGHRRPAAGRFVYDLAAYGPRVGFLLSTAGAVDSHEWERFESGIFAHEIRSALRGAADADGDGALTYDEVAAFVFTANQGIDNPRYRTAMFAAPPRDASGTSVPLPVGARGGARLVLGPEHSEHLYVEDARGGRILDFHPSAETHVELLLPPCRPLFVRDSTNNSEYAVVDSGRVLLAELSKNRRSQARRGAAHMAFSLLFARPFGPRDVAQYQAMRLVPTSIDVDRTKPASEWLQPWVLGSAVAVGAGGLVLSGLAFQQRSTINATTPQITRVQTNDRIRNYNRGAVVAYASAGLLSALYGWWTLSRPDVLPEELP